MFIVTPYLFIFNCTLTQRREIMGHIYSVFFRSDGLHGDQSNMADKDTPTVRSEVSPDCWLDHLFCVFDSMSGSSVN